MVAHINEIWLSESILDKNVAHVSLSPCQCLLIVSLSNWNYPGEYEVFGIGLAQFGQKILIAIAACAYAATLLFIKATTLIKLNVVEKF